MSSIVTLSSDFGPYYPAAMRGVLVRRGIEHVMDLTHELPAQDISQSAFWLSKLIPYQPRAVHCIVVDPGVGGTRSVIIFRVGGHAIVCPDNGVGWPVAEALAGDERPEAFTFEHVAPESHTFHGRDVFAPVAAAIATVGIGQLERLPTVESTMVPTTLSLPTPDIGKNHLETEIIATDGFGTAITDTPGCRLPAVDSVEVDGQQVPVIDRYGAVEVGAPLVTVGSHGHVELAVNQGDGSTHFDVDVGDVVRISWNG